MQLTDKVIVITGASRGIGEAIAIAALGAGASVVLASRKQPDLDRVAAALPPDRVLALACHTGKASDVDALFEAAAAKFGHIDGLVNNAATNPYFGPMLDTPDAALDKTIEVNIKGYLYATRALVRHARSRTAPATIVNIASVFGSQAAPMQGTYGMTKAAVISMTRTLAYELASSKIRVNCIAPGLVDTRFASAIINTPMIKDAIMARTPLGRPATPDEIAGAALYLLSDASSYTTGSVLTVDGGVSSS